MNDFEPAPAEVFVQGLAGELLPCRLSLHELARGRACPDDLRDRLDERTVARFTDTHGVGSERIRGRTEIIRYSLHGTASHRKSFSGWILRRGGQRLPQGTRAGRLHCGATGQKLDT